MYRFAHNNLNVLDLNRSPKFYKEALNLTEVSRLDLGDFILVYMGDETGSRHQLELTWIKGRQEPYNLGDNEFHLAFTTDDIEAAHAKHQEMDCICYENKAMGLYFINDPDGYWLEIMPEQE